MSSKTPIVVVPIPPQKARHCISFPDHDRPGSRIFCLDGFVGSIKNECMHEVTPRTIQIMLHVRVLPGEGMSSPDSLGDVYEVVVFYR